jgi:hypothetical protein
MQPKEGDNVMTPTPSRTGVINSMPLDDSNLLTFAALNMLRTQLQQEQNGQQPHQHHEHQQQYQTAFLHQNLNMLWPSDHNNIVSDAQSHQEFLIRILRDVVSIVAEDDHLFFGRLSSSSSTPTTSEFPRQEPAPRE